MKRILIISFLFSYTCFLNCLLSQNELGTVGSFWLYSFEPHDGNGFGWDKIAVTNDTLIDGKDYLVLTRTYYREQTLPPLLKEEGEYFFGYLSLVNDSVLVNDRLIFDFGAQVQDTLNVNGGFDYDVEIGLLIDSITNIDIEGINYKKYYGNKFCTQDSSLFPYQEFEVVESVGAVNFDFFTWNVDGCILGGGSSRFDCYANGDFIFPSFSDCTERFLSSTSNQANNSIKVYPNPTNNTLFVEHQNKIEIFSIVNVDGSVVYESTKVNNHSFSIDVGNLNVGMYFLKLQSEGEILLASFIRN